MVAAPGIAHAAVCSNQTGTTNGYYYQMWSNGQGSACITIGSGADRGVALSQPRPVRGMPAC